MENQSEILFYTADDGKTKLQVRLEDDTVWLNQQQIALLFDKSRVTITEHIKNVFSEAELEENVVCRNFRHTTQHGAIQGKTQDNTVKYYNLDVIISVGYRVIRTMLTPDDRYKIRSFFGFVSVFFMTVRQIT